MSRPIRNIEDLDCLKAAGLAALYPEELKVLVGSASCGIAMGAREVEAAARQAVEQLGLKATVARTGCIGFCSREPLLDLIVPGGPRVCYGEMTPEKTRDLLSSYAADGNLRPEMALGYFAGEEHVSTDEIHQYAARRR